MLRLAALVLNCVIHGFLLLGAAQMTQLEGNRNRFGLSTGLYGLYAGLCMVPGFAILGAGRLAVLLLSACIAFGTGRAGRRGMLCFLLLSLALDGAAAVMGREGLLPLVVVCGIFWLLLCCSCSGRTVPVEIAGEQGTVQLTALRDTGNGLRDPVTGSTVLVVGQETAKALTGLSAQQLQRPLETLAAMGTTGFRLVPFSSVGKENGLLLAKRFQNVRIGDRTGAQLVAFAPQTIGGREFQALTGGME